MPPLRTRRALISSIALVLLVFLPISVAVVCKCTGNHCASDVCEGDYCLAALVQAGPKAQTRWAEEPTHLYVRGCAFFSTSLASHLDLINTCFEYDETDLEHEKRKVCVCSARMCNDGPLINASVNHFQQHRCDVEANCKGEYCLLHRPAQGNSASLTCANRTLPLFDQLLVGISVSPALAPTILPFPGQLDRSFSMFCPDPTACTSPDSYRSDDGASDQVECPVMYLRTEHRDDPEVCIPPKHGTCRGRFCLDIWFNTTTFRGYVLERRYRGCIDHIDAGKADLGQEVFSGNCATFSSPAVNVTACINGVSVQYWTSPFMVFLIFAYCLCVSGCQYR